MRLRALYFLIFLCSFPLLGQIPAKLDTLGSLPTSAAADSTLVPPDSLTSVSGVDTLVTYAGADSIVYSLSTRTMTLYRRGEIRFRLMQLTSERIEINWDTSVMNAFGIPDSTDSTGAKMVGTPVMKDGGEEYHGRTLSYNFKSKKGKIDVTDTKIDDGFYHGEEIKKVAPEVLFIEGGRYTTCDAPEPHYYFASPKMKVMLQDKIVAEPVYLYIADVPLFALPFGVFPSHGGRTSGIIAPAIVENGTHGRLLHHLGYYWAMNDYMDMNVKSDLYTKGSWSLSSDYRYSLRYLFSGGISGQFRKILVGEPTDPGRSVEESYQLNLSHHQEIDPTAQFNVNFTLASNNSFRNTISLEQALKQTIYSRATLSKSWEGTPNSVSLNVSRNQSLTNGDITETLPSLSFSHSQSYPLRFGSSSVDDETERPWYEMIGFGYGANVSNNRAKVTRKVDGIKRTVDGRDTLVVGEEYQRDRSQSISQDASLSIAPKLGYISITPRLSYSDQRTFSSNDVPTRNPLDSTLVLTNVQDIQRIGTLSTGFTLGTKLYGIFSPGILGIEGFRHTFTPNLSFTYNKQIIGTSFAPKQMLLGFSVGNIFEMKTSPSDEGIEGSKIQLLNAGVGISYNFSADSLNFSGINLNYRTGIGGTFDISGDANFDLYKLVEWAPQQYRRVNKFLLQEEGRLARLTSFSINLGTSFSAEKSTSASTGRPSKKDSLTQQTPASNYYGLYREEDPDFSIPWQLSLRFNYSENKLPPDPSRAASVQGSLDFNLTDAWKFSTSGGYDLLNKEVTIPQVSISRDLHCWIMNFYWIPIGPSQQYRFEIRVKAPQLQDIKVTKQGSERGIY